MISGWWFGCHEFYVPINIWVANHPNWRSHICQVGVAQNHQPGIDSYDVLDSSHPRWLHPYISPRRVHIVQNNISQYVLIPLCILYIYYIYNIVYPHDIYLPNHITSRRFPCRWSLTGRWSSKFLVGGVSRLAPSEATMKQRESRNTRMGV